MGRTIPSAIALLCGLAGVAAFSGLIFGCKK
jgi:hypothetical protein